MRIVSFLANTTACSVLGVMVILLSLSQPAKADETLNKDYGKVNTINEYSRLGSHATVSITSKVTADNFTMCNKGTGVQKVTCWDLTQSSKPDVTENYSCVGSAAAPELGGWKSISSSMTGKCFGEMKLCYGVDPYRDCKIVTDSDAINNIKFTPQSYCGNSVSLLHDGHGGSTSKDACAINYPAIANGGLRGDTNDDMFAADSGAHGFFEYRMGKGSDLSDPYRLRYITRSTDPSQPGYNARSMVMPSGPTGTFADYKNFLDKQPGNASIDNACYPVVAEVCKDIQFPMPPVDGVCGYDDGEHGRNVPDPGTTGRELCNLGYMTNFKTTATGWAWSCHGYHGGTNASCKATKIVDAACGPATGAAVNTALGIGAYQYGQGLCSSGSPSNVTMNTVDLGTTTSNTPMSHNGGMTTIGYTVHAFENIYSWTCTPGDPQGATVGCSLTPACKRTITALPCGHDCGGGAAFAPYTEDMSCTSPGGPVDIVIHQPPGGWQDMGTGTQTGPGAGGYGAMSGSSGNQAGQGGSGSGGGL